MGSPPSEMLEKVVQVGWEGVSVEDEGRLVFVLVFATAARLCFPGLLRELLCAAPGGPHISRFMLLG